MPPGSQFYIQLYKEKFKRLLLLNRLWEFDQTQQEWSLGGPLPKLLKWLWLVAEVGHGVKNRFSIAILKNLLVWNYKAQSFHFGHVASSRGPLPKLFIYFPGVKIDPAPAVTILHWMITSNDFFYWTANGNSIKLNRNGPWVFPYQYCWNGYDWFLERMFEVCP